MRMKNKSVIITGGASGIGLASAVRSLEEGANVVIADLVGSDGAARAAELDGKHGGRCIFKACDVTDSAQVDSLFEATIAEFGSVDAVFSNAGIGATGAADQLSDDDYLRAASEFFGLQILGCTACHVSPG